MLLRTIWRKHIECSSCPVYEAWVETQDEELFRENCRPAACELNEFEAMVHHSLLVWWVDLVRFQSAGVPVGQWMADWTVEEIRAYLDFKAGIEAQEPTEGNQQGR